MVNVMNKTPIKMKRSKSSNTILISRSSQTFMRNKSFMLNEKGNKSNNCDLNLDRLYHEAEDLYKNGKYEAAIMKLNAGAKINPNNPHFETSIKKSKTAIMNDLSNASNVLKQLQDEIMQYPLNPNLKSEIPMNPPDDTPEKIKNDYISDLDVKSDTMKTAVYRVHEKKLKPSYKITINDGESYKTVTATARDVKEYIKSKMYTKTKDVSRKDWKKLRSEFNKKMAKQEMNEIYEKEAKILEEKSNARQHCDEQINLIGRQYQSGKMTDVIRFSENFIKYLNKKPDKILPRKWIYLATAFNYLARANAEKGDYKKAKAFGEKLYRIAITSSNTELIAQSYILSGKIYVKFEKYKEAAFVWEKLIPLITDDEKKAWLYHEIGRCYFEMEKFDTSYRNGLESALRAGKCGSSTWSCSANVLLGQVEMKRNKYEEALKRFMEAKKHAELSDDEQTLKYIYSVQNVLNLVLKRNRSKAAIENSNEIQEK